MRPSSSAKWMISQTRGLSMPSTYSQVLGSSRYRLTVEGESDRLHFSFTSTWRGFSEIYSSKFKRHIGVEICDF